MSRPRHTVTTDTSANCIRSGVQSHNVALVLIDNGSATKQYVREGKIFLLFRFVLAGP
jgi:hypothetical protein